MGTKWEKSCLFQINISQKRCRGSLGIFWGSHGPELQFKGGFRFAAEPLRHHPLPSLFLPALPALLPALRPTHFPLSPDDFVLFLGVKTRKTSHLLLILTDELFFHTFILIAKWFKVWVRVVGTLKGITEWGSFENHALNKELEMKTCHNEKLN